MPDYATVRNSIGFLMAARSIETDNEVYFRLQDAYQEECGRSPSALLDKLNETFKSELSAIRSRTNASSQRDLISDKTIRNFFNAKEPQSLTEKNLNYLCRALLDCDSYQDAIAQSSNRSNVSMDWLDKYIAHFRRQYSTVQIPSMTESASLNDVYTESKISEELEFKKNKSIAELQAEMEPGFVPHRSRIEVSEIFSKHPRLMLWGTAGSGKTTALKMHFLAVLDDLETIGGRDKPSAKVPVFIALRRFSTIGIGNNLVEAIAYQIKAGDLPLSEAKEIALSMLKQGELVILLDGLDEVPKNVLSEVQQEISELVRNYPKNHFALTCRYGATDYVPAQFKEVEMTAFDYSQIEQFVTLWFEDSKEPYLDRRFLGHLRDSPQIRELAKNPLMLTMICSMYSEGGEFPKSETILFSDATEMYLRKWDSYRRIEHRDTIYGDKLSRIRRRRLFYNLAFEGMNSPDEPKYFWKRIELERFIKEFIANLPDVREASIDTDTRAILNALEAQDSLLTRTSSDAYTFSYRSFQEYFTAMSIVEEKGTDSKALKELLRSHVLQSGWRQVTRFAAEKFPSSDVFFTLLFQLAMNELSVGQLSESFAWWENTTDMAEVGTSSWRACFLTFDLKTDLYISRKMKGIDEELAQRIATKLRQINKANDSVVLRTPQSKLILDLAVIHTLIKDRAEGLTSNVEMVGAFDSTYLKAQDDVSHKFKESVDLAYKLRPKLGHKLEALQYTIPAKTADKEECDMWADKLRDEMISSLYQAESRRKKLHRTFQNDKPKVLNDEEVKALNNYLYIVDILLDCLAADVYCSRSLRKELISSLILPPDSDKIPARLQSEDKVRAESPVPVAA